MKPFLLILGDWQLRTYLPRGFFGLIVMSYLGRETDRSRRLLMCCISELLTRIEFNRVPPILRFRHR